MAAIEIRSLIDRLNPPSHRDLEAAAGRALSRTHYNIELEHWILQSLEATGSDLAEAVASAGCDPDRLLVELNRSLDRQRSGNGRAPGLAPELVTCLRDAWLLASVGRGASTICSGDLLLAALEDEVARARLVAAMPELGRIRLDLFRHALERLCGTQPGESLAAALPGGPVAHGEDAPALERFTIDLTARARQGRIDPVLGRDAEIRQVIDVLTRRRQNNPILTGEAGVGKTALVEGLALRIASGDVPEALRPAALRTLDLGLLQAGAGVKGEFEKRLRAVIDEAQSAAVPVILFIDEAHTLIGAGGAPGQGDAANLLKPALARGELRVIGATTWGEYKKHIEKDPALARRFQPIVVGEPDEATAVEMVRGLLPALETHHGVRLLDEAVEAAVRLSRRYIQGRQLPDKAVSLIDTACARVAMSQAVVPPAIEGRRRRVQAIEAERRVLVREELSGADHTARLRSLEEEAGRLGDELPGLEERWSAERQAAAELAALRERVEAEANSDSRGPLRDDLVTTQAELRRLQGDDPMVFPVVDADAVAAVVETWTGIPAGRMRAGEIEAVLSLRDALAQRVVGQDHALEAVSRAIRTSRAGLVDPRKPVGVFLMVGTSGVGKTETALALADILYGGEQNLTIINMTEFKEEHKVSLLMGSPPGYVGYGEGGVLTEAVRRRPHGVLLLDEIEKAHPGVQDVFFQVFDKGTMKDGEGRDIDFRNTVIIMTSNAGTAFIEKLFADPETAPDAAGLTDALRNEMVQHFKPAFLGRVDLVPYLPLAPATMRRIAALQVARIERRVAAAYGARTEISEAALDRIVAQARDQRSGARSIESYLARELLPGLSSLALASLARGESFRRVCIEVDGDSGLSCVLD